MITDNFYPIPETSDTMLPRAAAETKIGNQIHLNVHCTLEIIL